MTSRKQAAAAFEQFLKPLRVILLVLCISGFVVVVFDQVDKFGRREKTTSRSVQQIEESEYPLIVFCRTEELFNVSEDKGNSSMTDLSKAEYDNFANDIEVRLTCPSNM